MQEDPNYIPAYVTYFDQSTQVTCTFEFLPRAEAALTKAVGTRRNDAEAHLVLARLLMQYEYDWSGAKESIGEPFS